MSDDTRATSEARSAGAMLRTARERQGLHIAALAAAMKVPPAKLEALEAGRYDELTDATFVRALAQSVCRVLKIDAKPVLELLPGPRAGLLDRVDDTTKARFQESSGKAEAGEHRLWHTPAFWIVLLLLIAAGGFVLWPQRATLWPGGWPFGRTAAAGDVAAPAKPVTPKPAVRAAGDAPAAVAASTAGVASVATLPAAVEPVPGAPASAAVATETVHVAPADATSNAVPDLPAGLAVVRASEPSWIEAHDARGTVLLSRTLQPGEAVGLDGAPPLRLVIGNAQATEVLLRGKRVALSAPNRDNVVRVELK